jgi:hypothetical protein
MPRQSKQKLVPVGSNIRELPAEESQRQDYIQPEIGPRSGSLHTGNPARSRTRAILTDPQLWLPIGVLIIGITVLILVK